MILLTLLAYLNHQSQEINGNKSTISECKEIMPEKDFMPEIQALKLNT